MELILGFTANVVIIAVLVLNFIVTSSVDKRLNRLTKRVEELEKNAISQVPAFFE